MSGPAKGDKLPLNRPLRTRRGQLCNHLVRAAHSLRALQEGGPHGHSRAGRDQGASRAAALVHTAHVACPQKKRPVHFEALPASLEPELKPLVKLMNACWRVRHGMLALALRSEFTI